MVIAGTLGVNVFCIAEGEAAIDFVIAKYLMALAPQAFCDLTPIEPDKKALLYFTLMKESVFVIGPIESTLVGSIHV